MSQRGPRRVEQASGAATLKFVEIPDANALARRAGRWFGFGVAAGPVLDVADDAGLLGAIASLDGLAISGVGLGDWTAIGFFIAIGYACARLFAAHGPRGRWVLFVATTVPLGAYAITAGLRLSTLVAVIALAYAFVSWRFIPGGQTRAHG